MSIAAAAAGADETRTQGRAPDPRVVAPAALLLLGGAAALAAAVSPRFALLYLLGGALGLVLYHAAFGFTGSWRLLVAEGRGAGLRAQMVMLAVASALFLPIIADGELLGRSVGGALAPVGVSVLVGAFLFGVGMQLGGGCASGTLFTLGGGSTRMLLTLLFFMVGSVLGSAQIHWWLEAPSLGTIALGRMLGWQGALALQLGLFALIAAASVAIERRRHGDHEPIVRLRPEGSRAHLLRGPWPLVWGALLLALLNLATLALAGHPWTVSFGYTLWGAKLAGAAGLDLSAVPFWTWRFPNAALAGSVFENTTSVMNFGIVAGAFLAAGLAGRFAPAGRIPPGAALAAALGGLLMGYGARLAFGCNVGAYVSGIASGSLHGWLWLVAALAGTWLGIKLRPAFRLS